jgi:hypothetical protein
LFLVPLGEGRVSLAAAFFPLQWVGPVATGQGTRGTPRPPVSPEQGQGGGEASISSGQGIKVYSRQWLAPIAEVAVFRVGQVCDGATGQRREEELNHLTKPLIPTGRTGHH